MKELKYKNISFVPKNYYAGRSEKRKPKSQETEEFSTVILG